MGARRELEIYAEFADALEDIDGYSDLFVLSTSIAGISSTVGFSIQLLKVGVSH